MPLLEVGDDGDLRVPGKLLSGAEPHSRFELDVQGEVFVLRPAGRAQTGLQHASRGERVEAFEQWVAASPADTPDLPLDCLRRESIYD
jgi:hypothetical protein